MKLQLTGNMISEASENFFRTISFDTERFLESKHILKSIQKTIFMC